jgi:hypothetical protein
MLLLKGRSSFSLEAILYIINILKTNDSYSRQANINKKRTLVIIERNSTYCNISCIVINGTQKVRNKPSNEIHARYSLCSIQVYATC